VAGHHKVYALQSQLEIGLQLRCACAAIVLRLYRSVRASQSQLEINLNLCLLQTNAVRNKLAANQLLAPTWPNNYRNQHGFYIEALNNNQSISLECVSNWSLAIKDSRSRPLMY
jgi:hypothetical protein